MDGPVRLGNRMLSTEFQYDRHAQNRIELAYRRLQTPQQAIAGPETGARDATSAPFETTSNPSEIQG